MRHYLKLILLFTGLGMLVVCSTSYLIDPYAIYSNALNIFPRKIAAADKGRTVKPYQVLNAKPFTVLVGNSRVEIGLPDEHAFYQGKPVYNMGLPGAGISMQYAYASHAITHSDSVKQIVIALDFLDFTSRIGNIVTTPDNSGWQWRLKGLDSASLADKRRYIAERISLFFSLSALTDSAKTIFAQNRNLNALNRFGFNDGRVYFFYVANEGFGALYQQKAQELDQRLSAQNLIFSSASYHVSELDRFITQLKRKNITVYLLINPYQQPYLDKLTAYNLDGDFRNWKNEMAQIAAQHQLTLFDFAIASPIVTNIVDATSRTAQQSRYFWEPAHYRPAFGELMLNSLMTKNCQDLCKISSK